MGAPKGNQFAKDNPRAGRNTKLTPALIKKAREYLPHCKDEYERIVRDYSVANTENPPFERVKYELTICLPSVAGLARWLRVSRETIYAWSGENRVFSDIYQDVMAEQEQRLLNNGLSGKYQPIITKLLLTKHGYSDKQELTGKDGGAIQVEGVEISVRKQ